MAAYYSAAERNGNRPTVRGDRRRLFQRAANNFNNCKSIGTVKLCNLDHVARMPSNGEACCFDSECGLTSRAMSVDNKDVVTVSVVDISTVDRLCL